MAKSGDLSGQYEDMQNVVVLSAMSTGDNGNGSGGWDEPMRDDGILMSFSTGGNGSDELLGGPDMWMSFSTGGNGSGGWDELLGDDGILMSFSTGGNGSKAEVGAFVLAEGVGAFVLAEGFVTGGGNGGSITEYGYYMSFSTCGNGSGGLGCPGDDVVWLGSVGGNGSAHSRYAWGDDFELGGSIITRILRPGVGDRLIIGMDENGTVTSANIVRSNTTDSGCMMAEDIGSTNKDGGGEPEDESSGVLVAAGGVEVTTRDATVTGVAAVTTALLGAVIRRVRGYSHTNAKGKKYFLNQ
jgi:hypothetical protein